MKRKLRIETWLGKLNEPERSIALDNMRNDVDDSKDHLEEELAMALNNAFTWRHTKEGFDYWDNIFDKIRKNEYISKRTKKILK